MAEIKTDFNLVGAVQLNIKYLLATLVFVVPVPETVAGPKLAGVTSLSTQYDVVEVKAGVVKLAPVKVGVVPVSVVYHLIVPALAVLKAAVWPVQIVASLTVGTVVEGTIVTFKVVVALFVILTGIVCVAYPGASKITL